MTDLKLYKSIEHNKKISDLSEIDVHHYHTINEAVVLGLWNLLQRVKKLEEKSNQSNEAFQFFKEEIASSTTEINNIGVHISHCFNDEPESFGGYECCKYGDKYCPADPQYEKELERAIKESENKE